MDYKSIIGVGTKVLKSLSKRPMGGKALSGRWLPIVPGCTIRFPQEFDRLAPTSERALSAPRLSFGRSIRPAYFACRVSMYLTRLVTLCCT